MANLAGWLTTATVQVCLDARHARGDQFPSGRVRGPVTQPQVPSPADETSLADSTSRALLVALGTLESAERVAFVLHEVFGVAFNAIAPILGRSPVAAEVLAGGARRRLGGPLRGPGIPRVRRQEIIRAFLNACRSQDSNALQAVLDPDVVLRADSSTAGPPSTGVHGADDVALQALMFHRVSAFAQPILLSGVPGLIAAPLGRSLAVMHFTIRDGKIAAIDVITDPARLHTLDLTILPG